MRAQLYAWSGGSIAGLYTVIFLCLAAVVGLAIWMRRLAKQHAEKLVFASSQPVLPPSHVAMSDF
jgi:hypothetical protein